MCDGAGAHRAHTVWNCICYGNNNLNTHHISYHLERNNSTVLVFLFFRLHRVCMMYVCDESSIVVICKLSHYVSLRYRYRTDPANCQFYPKWNIIKKIVQFTVCAEWRRSQFFMIYVFYYPNLSPTPWWMRANRNRRKLIHQCDAYLITDFIIEFSFEDRNGMLFAIYTICFPFRCVLLAG